MVAAPWAPEATPPTFGTLKLRGIFNGGSFIVGFRPANSGLCVQDFEPKLDNVNFYDEHDDIYCNPTSCQVTYSDLSVHDGDVSVEMEAAIEFEIDAVQLQVFKEKNDQGDIDYHYTYFLKDPNKQGDHDPDAFFEFCENYNTSISDVEWLDTASDQWISLDAVGPSHDGAAPLVLFSIGA